MSENNGYNRYQGDLTGDLQGANQAWATIADLGGGPVVAVMPKQGGVEVEAPEETRRSEINAGGLGEGNQADNLRQKMQALGASAVEKIEIAEQQKTDLLEDDQVGGQTGQPAAERPESGEQAEAQMSGESVEPQDKSVEPMAQDTVTAESVASQEEAEKKFAEWQEWISGTVDEFWDKLQNKEWAEYEGIAIGEHGPHFEELRERLMNALVEFNPRVTPEALQARLDMATKMAMEKFADKKAGALHDAKVKPSGFLGNKGYKRAISKNYDRDLEKVLQGEVYEAVSDQYFDRVGLRRDMEQDALSHREQLVWWKMMRPEEAQEIDTGWGERTPFEAIEKAIGEPPAEMAEMNEYLSDLYGKVAERVALIPDERAVTRDKLMAEMNEMILASCDLVLKLEMAFSQDNLTESEYYRRLVTRDTLALEKLRTQGTLPRTGEIAEQQAALDQVEEEAIRHMAEAVKKKKTAEREGNQQEVGAAKVEYDYYRDLIDDGFAARRALAVLSKESAQAKEAVAQPAEVIEGSTGKVVGETEWRSQE